MGLLSGPQVNPVRLWMQQGQTPMPQQPMGQAPPQMGMQQPMGQMPPQMGMPLGAFSGNPQFQQQLQALMQQQGPGHMPVQFTPPPPSVPLPTQGGTSFGMGDTSLPSVLGINRFRGR